MAPSSHPRKRIVVCCDGTWLDSDGDYQTPSNVTRIARAVPPVGVDKSTTPHQPITQIVFYQNGVGTGSPSLYDRFIGGATGEGLAEHIREAYSFICLNYNPGDEIFLLGFSRGAFTARSISSLINAAGLLTSKGLEYFVQVFEDWEFQQKKDFKTRWPDLPFVGHKPPVTHPDYQRQLIDNGLTRPNIKVKCVAVWDTVGGLGIPMIGLLPQPPSTDFAFVDTRVESNIEYAFQALALDEHRRSFSPTIWDWPHVESYDLKILKQCWFPGVHSDIGGSYDDTALANLTLAWMISQLDPILTINHDYIMSYITPVQKDDLTLSGRHQTFTHEGRMATVSNTTPHPRPWGLGKIHDSMSFFFKLGGSRIRTPGDYREQELASQHGVLFWMLYKIFHRLTSRFEDKHHALPRLRRTNETIHSSVRIRMGKHGLGYNDKGAYDSQALEGWVMHGVETNPDTPIAISAPGAVGKMKSVVWKKQVYPEKLIEPPSLNGERKGKVEIFESKGKTHWLELEEEPLGAFERKILQEWPVGDIKKDFDTIVPGRHQQNVDRAHTVPLDGHDHVRGASSSSAGRNGEPLTVQTGKRRSETT
ncbi:uncharacterized protein PV07_02539 [Cladophialophora immunda]|uniref:T6SS Phospholipase effector Tle1-like catalytic domain-containing protein n=1 Tax=Cladophialophora immunda TaxID=569365 RepID=A0A0D1ZS08_9EURO|nr:uncharacterized protein PV07_02539 [Cladophialophora immunda]KIW30846.1 hypothetical protein PV07_02539 [Cladophialophora immunda]OQV02159.1 putative alpha/beta hydrolase domain-containing protein [Cladophialophora immunda]